MSQTMQRDLDDFLAGQRVQSFAPLPNTHVLGLGHKARHGKDYVANFIQANYSRPMTIAITPFSAALKAVARVVFGMTEKDAPLLQLLGTEVFRRKDPNVWTRALYWYLKDLQPTIAIIPDVRFPNELEFVRQLGGYAVRIERVLPDGQLYVAQDRDPKHPSETALDDYDFDGKITAESGDLKALERAAAEMFKYFLFSPLNPPAAGVQTDPRVPPARAPLGFVGPDPLRGLSKAA